MVKVYAIVCSVNGFHYVGCTKYKVQKRFREHRCLLRKKSHTEIEMIKDWHHYGEDAFGVVILEELQPDVTLEEKRSAELRWMNHFKETGKLYNTNLVSFQLSREAITKGVANCHKNPGNRWTPEANEKRRQTQTGRTHKHGWKISAAHKAKGHRPSLEAARSGARACHVKRYGQSRKTDEIV